MEIRLTMRSLLLVLTLALSFALVACNGKKGGTTPTPKGPQVSGPISEQALIDYFKARFPQQVADGTLELDFATAGNDIMEELRLLGYTDMSAIPALVPADFETKGFGAIKQSGDPTSNVAGLMRDLFIIRDARAYFTKAWRNSWVSSGPQDFPAPIAYGVDMAVLEELGVFGGEGGEGGWDENPCGGGGEWEENPC